MAVAIIMDFAEGTAERYDAVIEEMQLGGRAPEHAHYHAAGAPAEGRWRVIDVWDSLEAFQRFAQEKIGPITQRHGLPEPAMRHLELAEVTEGRDPTARAGFLQVVRMPGLDQQSFSAMDAQIRPGGEPPADLVFHVNGPDGEGNWVVIDTWTSGAARDRFIAEQVRPAMEAAGVTEPPEFEDLDLHATLTQAPVAH